MNLRQMRYYCDTVEAGSAVAAAERMHVAATAISMQLAQLEAELGGELFDRSRRPMEPTALGRFFYPRAKEILRNATKLLDDAKAVAEGRLGWLSIGYTRSTIFSVVPPAIRAFKEDHPDVRLELITMLSEYQPEHLLSGSIQVGIARYIEPPVPQVSLIYKSLFADPFCLAVATGHPLSRRAFVSAAELDGVPFITYPKDIQSRFADRALTLLRRVGVEPIVAHEALDIHTALGLTASGLGCCLVGTSVSSGSRRDLTFLRIANLPGDASTVYAVTKAAEPSKALSALLAALAAKGAEIQDWVAARTNELPAGRPRPHRRSANSITSVKRSVIQNG